MAEKENKRHVVALEIGSSKVRGAVGIIDNLGVVEVVAVEEEKIIDKVRYGCIQNVEVASMASAVLERLQENPAIHPREIKGVYVSLGGRSLMSSTTEVSISMPEETEITEPIIRELRNKAAATIGSERDVVDVIPISYMVDNKAQNTPVGTFGHSVSARMTVVSCNLQLKRMLRRVVAERLGLTICDFITMPLAEASLVLNDDERLQGCMFVDFGAETTTVVIFSSGKPVYLATLPMGSRNITLDITQLNNHEERAEELKKNVGNALPSDSSRSPRGIAEGIDYTELNNYIHARSAEIAANIVAQLDHAGVSSAKLKAGIVIVGGGARLRNFNELLQQLSNMPVRQGAPSGSVRIADGSIRGTEVIDVIAMLAEAARLPETACLSELPTNEIDSIISGTYEGTEADPEDENDSRIGKLDEDPIDDDDDNDSSIKNGPKKSPKDGKNDPKKGSKSSILSKLQERIRNLTIDNSGDFGNE